MRLSIISLNYKKPELTISCMQSLHDQYKQEFERGEFEYLIVDNFSEDESVKKINAAINHGNYKHTKVIANSENAGFGKGNNVGAKEAKGSYLLFLNNDTLAKDRGFLEMTTYLDEHEKIGILGGQLRNPDGSRQASAGRFYTLFYAFLLLLGMQKFGLLDMSPTKISKVDWVKGGLLMIRKKVFEALSGFDEKIFMYTEDMELCYRAQKDGYGVAFYPDITVLHKEHGSANRSFAIIHIYKGLVYFYQKHQSSVAYWLLKLMLYLKAYSAIIIGTLMGKSDLVKTYRQAIKF